MEQPLHRGGPRGVQHRVVRVARPLGLPRTAITDQEQPVEKAVVAAGSIHALEQVRLDAAQDGHVRGHERHREAARRRTLLAAAVPIVQLAPHLPVCTARVADGHGAELIDIGEELARVVFQKAEYRRPGDVVDDHARLWGLGRAASTAASITVLIVVIVLVYLVVIIARCLFAQLVLVGHQRGEHLVPQGGLARALVADHGHEHVPADAPAGLNTGRHV